MWQNRVMLAGTVHVGKMRFLMSISISTRQSQAGKSAAVRVHPYFTFTLSSSWILSGSVRFCQILSGSVRFCQVLSGFFRFDGYLNVYEVEPSWHVSSSQDPFIYYVQFGFKLGSLSFSEVF